VSKYFNFELPSVQLPQSVKIKLGFTVVYKRNQKARL